MVHKKLPSSFKLMLINSTLETCMTVISNTNKLFYSQYGIYGDLSYIEKR
jgi:hypothetical protein